MGTPLGRYDIIRTLTKGELTDLLLARADGMEGFQRHVAIKRLHASHAKDRGCLEAFVNEARLAAALHHHNIVQVLDIGQEGGQPYFAMEFVHGVDLRALLNKLSKRGEQLPLQHVVSIVAAAAAALHHAHEQRGPDGKPLGIVHRDVTPANILVGYDGNVKVVDFGIAKAAIKRIKTDQGVLKGRVPYMAPEQCAGKPVDRRSDVFALGIVTYELATVRRLFKGATEFLTMSAIVNGDIPKPSQYRRDVPLELEQIMMKALARDPADRYQTAGEMALALDEVALHVGVGASTTQLANYMKLQFGEQPEPWLIDAPEADPETTAVDFDGGASGLAPPPAESVKNNAIPKTIAATRSSPIAQVRNIITPSKGSSDDAKKAVPIDKSYSMSTDVEASSYERQWRRESTDSEHIPTEKVGRTKVTSPPPPPPTGTMPIPTHAGSPTPTDATEIVVPLPVMPLERPVVRRSEPVLGSLGGSSKSRMLIVAAAVAVVVIVAGAIVLWPGSDVPASAAPDRTANKEPAAEKMPEQKPEAPEQQKPEAPEQQKPEAPEQQKADTPSGLNATMADYDKAREEQAAAEKAAADKQAAADEAAGKKQTAADEAAAKKQAAADQAAAKKQAAAEEAAAKKQAAAEAAAEKAAAARAEKELAAEKAAADKEKQAAAKTPVTKRAPTKPAATKTTTVKRPAPKPAAKKSTKKGAKWNPDELFLGD